MCKDRPILTARRFPITGMCVIDLKNPLLAPKPPLINLNAAFNHLTSIERLKFLHGALGYSIMSTLTRVVDAGYFILFPVFHSKNTGKLLTSDIIILGHIDHKHKNVQTTQSKTEETSHDDEDWHLTLLSNTPNKTHDFVHSIIELKDTICML